MTKNFIECALNGSAGSNLAYFFRGDQFVTYNWVADRAVMGAQTISDSWTNLPLAFLPHPFTPTFDAALNGRESGLADYADKSYFFHANEYTRQVWSPQPPYQTEALNDIAAWQLPFPFTVGVDAAFSGKFSRQGKSYFFKGADYARYDWNNDQLDYVKPIASLIGMPATFAAGIDAAIDGDGPYADYGYLFKGDQYVRFNWDRNGTNPHVDGDPRPIVGNWPGLIELLFASEAKSKAFEWLWTAIAQLEAYRTALTTGVPYLDETFLQTALQTHFRFPAGLSGATLVNHIDLILPTFTKLRDALGRAPAIFRYRNEQENVADGRYEAQRDAAGNPILDGAGLPIPALDADGNPQPDSAAYTSFNGNINFTKLYPSRGIACRAAQVIHEAVHYVDSQNAQPNDIPEWYVTAGSAAVLGLFFPPDANPTVIAVRYDAMPLAIHNPSSYTAFSQHLRYRTDTRYGELRQQPLPGLW